MLFELLSEESRRVVERVVVQEEKAEHLLVAASGLVTRGKEYLHFPKRFLSVSERLKENRRQTVM